jgi:hypothetical protein
MFVRQEYLSWLPNCASDVQLRKRRRRERDPLVTVFLDRRICAALGVYRPRPEGSARRPRELRGVS